MSPKDLIRLFVRHRNAANLLAILALVTGAVALLNMNTQLFPSFGIDFVTVQVPWPGAGAEDVEANIVEAVEPEVRFLDSVKQVISFAVEGAAIMLIEFEARTDMQAALADVDSAISRVTTLPRDSETPVVQRVVLYDTISRLVLSGPVTEASLKSLAKDIRNRLLAAGIDQVTMFGARDEEIWVEIAPAALRRYDLTLAEIAARIAESSQDLPSGTLEGDFEKQIRSIGLAVDANAVGAIEVRALDDGQKIYLRDIASVGDGFDEDGKIGLRGGRPAVELHIQRSPGGDSLELADIVEKTVADVAPTLPAGVRLEHYDVQAGFISARINLLLRNGVGGLALVLIILFVFLEWRLAFWVAAGIPIALLAAMLAMLATGQSINMVSLFAIIMTLGIIVDDAIVVGEHTATLSARGLGPIEAAQAGAFRMLAPVTAASLTTIAAFLPILMISDVIGQIIIAIPLVVAAVILAALVEAFLILPSHMRDALRGSSGKVSRFRRWFDGGFDRVRAGAFRRLVDISVRWRYLTVSVALGLLAISLSLLGGGHLPFNFFPSPEAETVFANVVFAPGTPRSRTEEMTRELEAALVRAEDALTGGEGGLVVMSFAKIGVSQVDNFGSISGDHLGGLHVELVPSDQRSVRTEQFIEAWRAEIEPLPGVERISLIPRQGGPPGREIDIRITGGQIAVLKQAALEVRDLLQRMPGVSDVEDDLPFGKQEVRLRISPRGRALGFTTESVGRQVRDAFEGGIAKRFARGDEEVTVRVRYPRGSTTAATLRNLYLRAPSGAEVAISEVVEIEETQGFSRIRRQDGERQVAVVAEVDEAATTSGEILDTLRREGLSGIEERFGVTASFAGKEEERERTLGDMKLGALVALVSIYIILAWVFASYSRPLVVMAIIPFGIMGAIVGHMVMGYDLTILSLVALLGLSGILVNDSIILVSTIEERIKSGEPRHEAIVNGSCDRLRAVILTSLTTIGGLLPLMFETDLQARFMIPMAVTIVFGLLLATLLVLLLVPALVGVQDDVGRALGRRRGAVAAVGAGE